MSVPVQLSIFCIYYFFAQVYVRISSTIKIGIPTQIKIFAIPQRVNINSIIEVNINKQPFKSRNLNILNSSAL